jgi:hypothetical protein
MKCNIGRNDKTLRIIAGLLIIALGIIFKTWLGAIGLIPILTALAGFCPLYLPLKISTVRVKSHKDN